MIRLRTISLFLLSLAACASPHKDRSRPPIVEVTNDTDRLYVVTAVIAAGDARGQDVNATAETSIVVPGRAWALPVDRERLMRVQFLVTEWDESMDELPADGEEHSEPNPTRFVSVRHTGREKLTCMAVVVAGTETGEANGGWVRTFDLEPSESLEIPFENERLEQVKLVIMSL